MGKVKRILRNWGLAVLYPRPFLGLIFIPRFLLHFLRYSRLSKGQRTVYEMQPCLGDWTSATPFDAHYFYQGAWLARILAAVKPESHVDVGTSVMTIATISAFVPIEFIDVRPLQAKLHGLQCRKGDILHLPFKDKSIKSISCMHVIEHIGLGRYGDPLDPAGSEKAATELKRVLASGGKLYLTLPVGRERICFNAHRVHHPAKVLQMFEGLQLVEFSYVDDRGHFHAASTPEKCAGMEYACGMYQFFKP